MIGMDATRLALDEINGALVDAHVAASRNWRSLVDDRPDLALPCSTTTRANFMHNHIVGEIGRAIDGKPGFEMTEALKFHAVRVGHEILLRFKFVGDGVPSNVATVQQKLLASQTFDDEMLLALDHPSALTPPTLLTCGYTLDVEGAIARIEVRCDCKGHQPWAYDIYGGTSVSVPTVIPTLEDTSKPARITKPGKAKRSTPAAEAESSL